MADISHIFGGDLAWSAAGDVAIADAAPEGRQRVLRRILTVSGNYIWELAYGGGGAALVGSIATFRKVEAVMRAQMFMEACVSQSPPPTVQVSQITNGLSINISYIDAQTADPVYLAFSVT